MTNSRNQGNWSEIMTIVGGVGILIIGLIDIPNLTNRSYFYIAGGLIVLSAGVYKSIKNRS